MKIKLISQIKFKSFGNKIPRIFFGVFCLVFFISFPSVINAIDTNVMNFVTVSATILKSGNNEGGGGGGENIPSSVNFSGMASPFSKITILNNGVIAKTIIADASARFSASITGLSAGTYNFSVFGVDSNKVKSLTFSFPVYVKKETTIDISGIFLSPTISIDKSEVKKGDNIVVFGQTVPNTQIDIVFNSDQEIIKKVKTDLSGLYSYIMNTSPLQYGEHKVKSKAMIDEEINAISAELPFTVGYANKLVDNCSTIRGDVNCDGKVNLTDFSIVVYWYKKVGFPPIVDINSDGKISLIDFSIMAFNWTG